MKKPALKTLLRLLSPRRLVIYLALIIGGISLLGLVIPQNESAAYYEAHYQPWLAKSLNILSLYDVYGAWYFISAIALLALCLLACTVRSLLRVVAAFRRGEAPVPPAESTTRCEEIASAEAFTGVKARLKRLPFKWHYAKGVLYGRRRPYAAVGEVLFNVGLLLILVGGLLRVFGHSEEIFIFEGHGAVLPPYFGQGLEVRADRIDAAVDANTGDVLEYRTTVRVLDSGKEVALQDVEANRPLHYGGVGIYQSRTGATSSKGLLMEVVELEKGVAAGDYGRAVFDWKIGGESGRLTLAPGEAAGLGDTGLRFRYVDYLEKFFLDDAGISDDGPAYNPVAFVNVVNARGETAIGFLYKLTPEESFIRADSPDFDARAAKFTFAEDGGPWRADRRECLFASGSCLAVGGEVMKVTMGAGEGTDLRMRSLEGAVVGGEEGAETRYEFPFGKRVKVHARDGEYLLRFVGTREAPVTGFTVTRDPGLAFFYVGCALLTIGVFAAALLRHDELFAYVRGGRVCLAARSGEGADVPRDVFDRWVDYAKGG